jgi:hypothetical protein
VVVADRDIIGAPNGQKCPVVPGAFSWGVIGASVLPRSVPHRLYGTEKPAVQSPAEPLKSRQDGTRAHRRTYLAFQ